MNPRLIIPPKLKKGDTVGFISPSAGLAPFAMHRIERAKKMFNKFGYKVKIARNALKNKGYISGSIRERVDDIHQMFRDHEVRMIIATIGGNHSNQLLNYLDYDLIKRNKKIFMGYSDNTVLHFALQSRAKLATYYGPCVMTQFGEYPEIFEYTLKYFNYAVSAEEAKKSYQVFPSDTWTEEILDWFKKEDIKRPRKMKRNNGYEWLKTGVAKGPLLGGAIPSINHLAGTKYWRDPRGTIYFLDIPESNDILKGLSISDVDSYLADLDNLGVFNVINGLIVGRPYRYSQKEVKQLKEIILKYSKNKKYPILYNANIGHTDPIITIQYGATAKLNSRLNCLSIEVE